MADDFQFDPELNYDEATLEQQRQIEKDIADAQPLISDRIGLDQVIKEYTAGEDQVFVRKIEEMKSTYKCVRKTRADGNCFFRAYGYACFENFLTDKADYKRFHEVCDKTKDDLITLGFPQFTIEDFHTNFMEAVTKLETIDQEELISMFNDQGLSDYLVVYLRLIVSGLLQKEHEFYANFIEGYATVKDFCGHEVEPMGKESDHIHITALTQALGVPVQVLYMDHSEGSKCNLHVFPEDSKPSITLLYRPGHYDVLYS
ncbi:ubiquitin thioesterase OTUB1-like [Mytilus galloprovincialis]|uniref:ubiquitinyl hydrolase 1 n=3 Tax=Mytilus TaxID=6548 RepID=A0A8S3V3D7_MYTED|nr:OTUB1 [Mytilus edulis]